MTNDADTTLSRTLGAIDRVRRRTYATFAFFWILTFAALLWFTHVLRTTDNLKTALSAAVVALVFAIFLGAFAVMVHITRMTRRILRAIDLSAAEGPPAASGERSSRSA